MKRRYVFLILIIIATAFFLSRKILTAESNEAVILDNQIQKEEEYVPDKMLFVGDMMFDRGVERVMQEVGFSYPIDSFKTFAFNFDYLVGNLEGPINENPKEFSDESLKFSFNKKVLESLQGANFKVLSLANNHTLNMGEAGLEETKSILSQAGINYTGDPIECEDIYKYQKDGITFFGINTTFPINCSDEDIVQWVKAIKYYNPETIFIALMHWGQEYKESSAEAEQSLAHQMIDNGVDIVIGGHPHVSQEIELYNNHLIFYSLGNFIFDQYFSKETQEGLAVGLEIYPNKKVFNLYPVKNKVSQAKIMDQEEKQVFLNALAEKSSETLKESIRQGKIEINN
jgi:poly-gamma-glutamate synthesis protein (capsule biosynthesis protein)